MLSSFRLPIYVLIVFVVVVVSTVPLSAQQQVNAQPKDLSSHPWLSYEKVQDIDSLENSLRKHLSQLERYSFSRSWWKWDRLRARYVDGGRQDKNALRILRAVFRGLILDWHERLTRKGEGDLFYIFFVTTAAGNTNVRKLGDRTLIRDYHGGGYHGGWGGASRMRIYEELVRGGMLTKDEQDRVREIVYQSLSARFLDFKRGSQVADNHSFGNAGGVAMALKLFPKDPTAKQARAWIDRIWGHLSDFGDWKEWTYYPYGPIFLHGLLDVAEATGRIESERELINTLARRVMAFSHGNGVRGNPNSGARTRKELNETYTNPWDVGYYNVETSGRDGNFWYRLAQHYKSPEYLWVAEHVLLGGRGNLKTVPAEYEAAYQLRFAWFVQRGIEPKLPSSKAAVGYLSPAKHCIPERLYLNSGREPGKPFAAYFLYDKKSGHLDNISGHLYEYSFNGAKLLHTSGKYNNVYSGNNLKGGGTGEESLDLLLILNKRHRFPLHPDRHGDKADYMRRGSIVHRTDLVKAENNPSGDSFGQFGYDHYYGEGSRWTRQSVLTAEGYFVVADTYEPGKSLGANYTAGPVWHLAPMPGTPEGARATNWFDAPAIDQAWWQDKPIRVLLLYHDDGKLRFGSLKQTASQDTAPNITTFASRPIRHGQTERFLSVFIPHDASTPAEQIVKTITTRIEDGDFSTQVGNVSIAINNNGSWKVSRKQPRSRAERGGLVQPAGGR